MEIQHQIKQNAQQIRELHGEMLDFEKEMQKEDEELKKKGPADLSHLPPVRKKGINPDSSVSSQQITSSKQLPENPPIAPKRRVKPRSPEEWDKIDYDELEKEVENQHLSEDTEKARSKKLEEIEKNKQKQSVSNATSNYLPSSTLPAFSSGKQKAKIVELSAGEANEFEANDLKEKGNSYFRTGAYKQALDCYNQANNLMSSNPIILCNRAACYLKLSRAADAETFVIILIDYC
jgi:tetratricopeptide (TPR) repeat protein